MKRKNDNSLWARFLRAETTEAEELRLQRYVEENTPSDLEARLSRAVDNWASAELPPRRRPLRRPVRWAAAIALLAVLAGGLALSLRPAVADRNEQAFKDTFDNPEDAARETRRALLAFSNGLSRGLDCLNHHYPPVLERSFQSNETNNTNPLNH